MFYKKGGGGKEQLCDRYGRYCRMNTDRELSNFYNFKFSKKYDKFLEDNKYDKDRFENILKNNNVLNDLILTEHFFMRVSDRKITQKDFENTLLNPISTTDVKIDMKKRSSFDVIGEKVTISINPFNHCITTIHNTHTRLVKKIRRFKNEV